jgi:hypothetical protein
MIFLDAARSAKCPSISKFRSFNFVFNSSLTQDNARCRVIIYFIIIIIIYWVRVRVRVRVRVSPREKILRGWCSGPERTGILNIHELACAYPCCNARQSLCFEDPVE